MSVKQPSRNGKAQYQPEILSPEWIRRVLEAGERLAERTKTKKAALELLVEEGIYTKSGRLTKNYR